MAPFPRSRFHETPVPVDTDEPVTSIARDQSMAVALGFTGTPTFLVNGLKYVGVIDSLQFDAIFDEARGR